MKTIGVTGGIGSGKSTVCAILKTLGIAVFNSDEEAKKVYTEQKEVLELLRIEFGPNVFTKGELNKSSLAAIVFADKNALLKLNHLLHPFVKKNFEMWKEKQTSPYVVREAAIMIESDSYKDCDAVVLVTAPENIRIDRVRNRNGWTVEEIKLRMNNQLSDDAKLLVSDYSINNNGTSLILPQIVTIHTAIMKKIKG